MSACCSHGRATLPEALHARTAMAVVRVAQRFTADITARWQTRAVDAKSLTALLALGAPAGATLDITAEGPDAQTAVSALREALESVLRGSRIPVAVLSPGRAVGRAVVLRRPRASTGEETQRAAGGSAEEIGRLNAAFARVENELAAQVKRAEARGESAAAEVLSTYRLTLQDAALRELASAGLSEGLGALDAIERAVRVRQAELGAEAPGSVLGEALEDVGQRLARQLGGQPLTSCGAEPVILVAECCTPADLEVPGLRLAGVVLVHGGPASHSAIVARALGLPMVAGLPQSALDALVEGQRLLIDSAASVVDVEPAVDNESGAEWLASGRADLPQGAPARGAEPPARGSPLLLAEADSVAQIAEALAAGAEGIGLVRTERLFGAQGQPASEAEQVAAYAALLAAAGGRPVTIRTLDQVQHELSLNLRERLPVGSAGLRGAALSVLQPRLLDAQLRALARASEAAPLRVLVPYVATPEAWAAVRERWAAAAAGASGAHLGPMVETPSAALDLDAFLEGAGHVSIGTNDLLSGVFGVSRESAYPEPETLWLQPGWLRLLREMVRRAHARAVPVNVCGVMASATTGALLLAGLGADALTVPINALAEARAVLEASDPAELAVFAEDCCSAPNLSEVRRRLGGAALAVHR